MAKEETKISHIHFAPYMYSCPSLSVSHSHQRETQISHIHFAPHYQHLTRMVHLLPRVNYTRHIIFIESPYFFLDFTFGVVHLCIWTSILFITVISYKAFHSLENPLCSACSPSHLWQPLIFLPQVCLFQNTTAGVLQCVAVTQ